MSRFWPDGLSLSDTQSPYEMLESAREEWATSSEGILNLVLQQDESQDGNVTITVHAKHVPSNRTETLFSIIHRMNAPYPIAIQPREDRIPSILKKSYIVSIPSPNQVVDTFYSIKDKEKTVTNEWVSDTPSEFRDKLSKAFNLSNIKAAILNLTSNSNDVQSVTRHR